MSQSVLESILEQIFSHEAVQTRQSILKRLEQSNDSYSWDDLIQSKELVALPENKFTWQKIIEYEKRLAKAVAILTSKEQTASWPFPAMLSDSTIARAKKNFIQRSRVSDNPHKRADIHAGIMQHTSRLVVLSGSPGTAKSTAGLELLKAYRHDRTQKNKDDDNSFWVLAKNPFAMEKWCSRAGVQGSTIDQVLTTHEMGVGMIPKGAFVIVDEAGLIGTRDMMRLIEKAVRDQWQKLVLLGDIKQDMPKAYGQPLAYLMRCFPDVSFQLTTPFRQRNKKERNFVHALYCSESAKALAYLEDCQRLIMCDGKEDVFHKAALFLSQWRFSKAENRHKQCFCVVPDKKTVNHINSYMITAQNEKNKVTDAYPLLSPQGKEWFVGKGDRVILQNTLSRKKGIKRGQFGTVIHSDKENVTVAFDQKYGKKPTHTFKRMEPFLSPGYALTYDEAQGIAADCVCVIITEKIAGPQMMAACSRHRYECHVYADKKVYADGKALAKDIAQFPVKKMPYLDTL